MTRTNPPLNRVRQLGPNMTEVQHGDIVVLYSYETPVAVFAPGHGYLRTTQQFSNTTSRHISKWLDGVTAKKVPQATVAHLAQFADSADVQVAASNPSRKGRYAFSQFPGCYIDGAYGQEHALDMMKGLLQQATRFAPGNENFRTLIADIEEEQESGEGEFADELLNDATDALADVTAPHLYWDWEGGDLCLVEAERR